MRSFTRRNTASVASPRLKLGNSLRALCVVSLVPFRSQHRPACGASSLWIASRRMRTPSGSPAASDSASAPEIDMMDMLLGQEFGDSHSRDAATTASAPSTSSGPDAPLGPEAGEEKEEKEEKEEELTLRVVELHNLPRNWMHEEIVEFLHQVANHAGIDAPAASASTAAGSGASDAQDYDKQEEGEGEDVTSAIPHVRSPFVAHMHIPFGRRTGLVYGSPRIVLRSGALAHYLVNDLAFDEDDYRSRIYFSDVTPVMADGDDAEEESGEKTGSAKAAASARRAVLPQYVPIEETIEQEQAAALATLELDRYLLAPDLLLDISKMHQRRLVTRGEKVVLRAFTDMASTPDEEGHTPSGSARGEQDEGMEAALFAAEEGVARGEGGVQPHSRRRRAVSEMLQDDAKPAPRAGTMKDLGHGSAHNMPIPKPYVMGRNL